MAVWIQNQNDESSYQSRVFDIGIFKIANNQGHRLEEDSQNIKSSFYDPFQKEVNIIS